MAKRQIRIAPSILSADFNALGKDVAVVEECGIDVLHFDVMDGSFVDSISFGIPVLKCLRPVTDMFMDVHLMVVNPEKQAEQFIVAGADGVTFHLEACRDPISLLRKIHQLGAKGAVAINPETPAENLSDEVLRLSDMILVMTVHPGKGGQKYIDFCTEKVRYLRKRLCELGETDTHIQVDGGINRQTVYTAMEAGADVIVAGSAVFEGDVADNARFFREAAENCGTGEA